MELVQPQDTTHTETPKVSRDHTQTLPAGMYVFFLIFQSSMGQRDVQCQGFCTLLSAPRIPLPESKNESGFWNLSGIGTAGDLFLENGQFLPMPEGA